MSITCPNCLAEIPTEVHTPTMAILCNGRGEHITSADPMNREERQNLLVVMEHRQEPTVEVTERPDGQFEASARLRRWKGWALGKTEQAAAGRAVARMLSSRADAAFTERKRAAMGFPDPYWDT